MYNDNFSCHIIKMFYFMFVLSIYLKICFTLYDYEDPILRKQDLILKSRICDYLNFLPICSETILYRSKPKRRIYFNHFGAPYELSHSFYKRNHRRRWYNSEEYEPKYVCNYCKCSHFPKRHYLMPFHYDNNEHAYNYWMNNWKHKYKKIKKRKSKMETSRLFVANEYNTDICTDFLRQINNHLEKVYNNYTVTQWNYDSNLTDFNKELTVKAAAIFYNKLKETWKKANEFDKIYHCSNITENISRQFNFLSKLKKNTLPFNDYLELQSLSLDMETIYSIAKINDYKDKSKILQLEPDITHIMAYSRDYNELQYIWEAWRNETGKKMKTLFPEYVHLLNKAAQLNGYPNAAELWLSEYEYDGIEKKILQTWQEIKPFYLELHAYVRYKLQLTYHNANCDGGLIPAHLLGNIFGQTWINIYNITAPYPEFNFPDISTQLQKKKYTPKMMFLEAEKFYKSINLSEMTQDFWKNSIIEQRIGIDMVCHASAWDMYNKTDFRIKMCTHITYENFIVIHHEMGHIQYFMAYKDLPFVFKEGANPGFHEAIGDTIALSVSTPEHLRTIGLFDDSSAQNKYEKEINYLFLMALQKIAFLPYALVVDLWRWNIFRGKIDKENYNTHWWELKKEYQGIKPPTVRPEIYFDPCAKYHIAAGVPYIRLIYVLKTLKYAHMLCNITFSYFISFVIQFQFHEALCKKAGKLDNENPLHTCDIYLNIEAGNLLQKMLSLGQSKSWPEAMHVLTNIYNINSGSILLYFKPLEDWLKNQNKILKLKIGWE